VKANERIILTEQEVLDHVQDAARFLQEKKGENTLVLDLKAINSYFNYFIITTGNSHIHLRAMGRELEKHLIARGLSGNFKPDFESNWIVLDYFDVIVHIFTEETRGFYQLEKLWADASVVPF